MQKNFIVGFNKKNNLVFIDLDFNLLEVAPVIVYEPFVVTSLFIDGKRILDEKTPTNYTALQMSVLFESFTQIERYLISSDFFDAALLKEEDFRKSNSLFTPMLSVPVIAPLLPLNYPSIIEYPPFFMFGEARLIAIPYSIFEYLMNSDGNIRIMYSLDDVTFLERLFDYSTENGTTHYWIGMGSSERIFKFYIEDLNTGAVSPTYPLLVRDTWMP